MGAGQGNGDFFFTAYATANEVETEIETESKHGVTIVRPVATFRLDHSSAFGIELDAAIHREVTLGPPGTRPRPPTERSARS